MARVLARLVREDAELLIPRIEDPEGSAAIPFDRLFRAEGYSIPNRATGFFPSQSLETAGQLLSSLERTTIEGGWTQLAGEALRGAAAGRLVPPEMKARLSGAPCPVQLVWCCRRPEPDEDLRQRVREIDTLYAAVKRTRPIAPWNGAEVPKCVQCGRREALGGQNFDEWRDFHARLAEQKEIALGYRFEPHEALCSVCAVKRLAAYLNEEPFPSTSEIAARDWWETVGKNFSRELETWQTAVRGTPGYEQPYSDLHPLLYARTLRRVRKERPDESARLERVEVALAALQDAIRDARRARRGEAAHDPAAGLKREPSNYLAVVVFDGDDMGRAVQEHIEVLPQRLADFARRAQGEPARDRARPRIPPAEAMAPDEAQEQAGLGAAEPRIPPAGAPPLEAEERATAVLGDVEGQDRSAQPFYLGGDEGLLLCPLESLLALCYRLRELWRRTVEHGTPPGPTLSMGATVFDREQPLGAAIELARQALAAAKGYTRGPGRRRKDALAVTVETASAGRWTALAPWGSEWRRIERIVALIRSGELAAAWPHDVECLVRGLDPQSWTTPDARRAAVEEIRRLTWRRTQRDEPGAGEQIWNDIQAPRDEGEQDEPWPQVEDRDSAERLADRLALVAFLAREGAA